MKTLSKKPRFSLDKTILNSKFNYCKKLKWFLIAPAILILVGIILLCTVGFNLGIDFTGGSTLRVFANSDGRIENSQSYDLSKQDDFNKMQSAIQEVLNDYAKKNNLDLHDFEIKVSRTSTSELGDCIEVQYQDLNGDNEHQNSIKNIIREKFGYINQGSHNYDDTVTVSTITATATSELLMNCFIAMLVAMALILIYVGFRFEFTSGLAAILALFHDLAITTALVLICRIEINASFVAALVTILGYSINNTIIIFDRIRENRKNGRFDIKSNSLGEIANNNVDIANASVKETMTRSVYTTLTTLVTIALVAIIGVYDIRVFALPIIFGIGAGFYSSVFLTSGLWAIAYRPRKKKAEKKKVVSKTN